MGDKCFSSGVVPDFTALHDWNGLVSPKCRQPNESLRYPKVWRAFSIGVIRLRAAISYLCERPLPFLIYFSSSSPSVPLYASTLPSARGHRLRAAIFHSRQRPLRFLISFSSSSSYFPYMPPLSPPLGVIHLRTAVFIGASARFHFS